MAGRLYGRAPLHLVAIALLAWLISGCGGAPKHTARSTVPRDVPPPTVTHPTVPTNSNGEIIVPKNAKPIYTETGRASWYGPRFQNRHAANGEIFDMNQLTAAHRTIPLNSIARVTNVKTGESVVLRITDRGPFVGDRVIDLSKASAQRVGVYVRGGALVRIDVLQSPAPVRSGGRWCVQIGAFAKAEDAATLKARLARRYQTAKVAQFDSPDGGAWVRVRVADDDKRRAEELIKETKTQASVFLVRLD